MDLKIQDTPIQVWGLHRSGTNFVEWLIRNNIKNNNYERREARSAFHGKQDALKHCYPDITRAQYHICIYKPIEEWLESHDRYTMKKLIDPRDAYWKWINLSMVMKEQYPDNVLLVNFNDFIGKELYYFRAQGWDIEYKDIWQVPMKRMGKGSGTNYEGDD